MPTSKSNCKTTRDHAPTNCSGVSANAARLRPDGSAKNGKIDVHTSATTGATTIASTNSRMMISSVICASISPAFEGLIVPFTF